MNIEIIVVDDASEDNTAELAKSFGCKVLYHNTNKGPVIAKNTGLKAAKGKFIMFHDADDVMTEGALNKLYTKLSSSPDIDVVMAKVQDFISPDCNAAGIQIKQEPYYGLFTGAVLIKKNVFDKIGLFDENLQAGEIISFQSKLDENNLKLEKMDFVSTNRRIHNSNFGRTNQKQEYNDYAAILRAKIAARRNNG